MWSKLNNKDGFRGKVRNFYKSGSKLAKDKRGNVAITAGLVAMPLVFMVGVTVDYTNIARERSELQELSDAAALYAVKRVNDGFTTEEEFENEAEDSMEANYEHLASEITMNLDKQSQKLHVDMAKTYTPAFLGIMGHTEVDISVLTEVTYSETYTDPRCIYTLGEDGRGRITVNGGGKIDATGCTIQVNSEDDAAVNVNGSGASIDANLVCVKGGVGQGSDNINGAIKEDCAREDDPFGTLDTPPVGSCDFNDVIVNSGKAVEGNGNKANVIATADADDVVTLSEGTYCGGLDIKSDTSVFLSPGTYVFKDGPLELGSQGGLTGDDVLLYFTGSKIAINFTGQGAVDLSAPDPDDADYLPNFVIYFDKASSSGTTNYINGGANSNLEGIVYLGNGALDISGEGTLNADSPFSIIIAEDIDVSGGAVLKLGIDPDKTNLNVPDEIYETEIIAYISK